MKNYWNLIILLILFLVVKFRIELKNFKIKLVN